MKRKKMYGSWRKALSACLAAAVSVTALPTGNLSAVWAATPQERKDASIVYFVDCGDYVVDTVSDGDQLGTRNSVTDQVYGEDAVTGYSWGIVDGEELADANGKDLTNGTAPDTGGVYTANTWAFEQNDPVHTDYPKTQSNRYSKNFYEKGIAERYVDYAFELDCGTYEVTVGCVNPWNCSNSPSVTAAVGETEIVLAEALSVPKKGSAEAAGNVKITEDGSKMTVDVRGTGDSNLCVNVGYILIREVAEEETEDEKAVRKDKEALTLTDATTEDLELPSSGANGSKITWTSSDPDVIAADGKVTRPAKGEADAAVTMTATITSGKASDTKEFTVKVAAYKVAVPADREDNDIVYFVDCGDYLVNTVSDGDQFGTHNSVTDQVFGEDPVTGYTWGIVDTVSTPLKNGSHACGGVFTDNTWPYESNTAKKDTVKTSSNRYTKNQFESGIDERYLDYSFELEDGTYDVSVVCIDPWGVSKSPDVYLNYGTDSQVTVKEGLDASAKEVGKKTVDVTNGKLTVDFRGSGQDNLAINVAYILIRNHRELTPEEALADAKKRVSNDYAALVIEDTDITDDLTLAEEGANETAIRWESSDPSVISANGKVTRPKAGEPDAGVTLTATVSYGDLYSLSKIFSLKVLAKSDMSGLQEFTLGDIEMTDDYYINVTEKDVAFLNKFDPDRLLYNFRLTAGYTAKQISDGRFDFNKDGKYAAKPYSGWENSKIGGHTMGHYLAAVAQAVADGYGDVKDEDGYSIKDRLDYLVDGLKDCQDKLGTGFIFGAQLDDQNDPERQFNTLEKGSTSGTWVPWYTMHKILNGLVETYKYTGSQTALEVAESLGEWVYNRTSAWDTTVQNRVLGVEYGGMNDCLYELYKCARDTGYEDYEHFSKAAHWFDEDSIFEKVLAGEKNVLNGRHANCTIPKFIGALNRYRALKDDGVDADRYLAYAEAFWTLITEHHTYITGGNSECEFFGADNVLDAERSHCNCETCNTHNMLKLTRELYRITGDKKYADYYETTFINAIMASVNEETGMTTYFQPMATGFFKVYCNPDVEKNYFWCCTGTGLENFTKLGDSFYYHTKDQLIVNQYISSNITWKEKKLTLKQESSIPDSDHTKFTVNLLSGETETAVDLRLRIPDWIAGEAAVTVNGEAVSTTVSGGYISLNRTWKDGDVVDLTLPMEIRAYTLPDKAGTVYGFKYGPVVLAAELGTDDKMDTYQVGVQCDVCKTKIVNGEERTSTNGYGSTSNQGTLPSETLNVPEDSSVSGFIENIENYLVKDENSLTFTLNGTDWGGESPLVFTPYYRIHDQRYGIYWLFAGSDQAEIQERILKAKKAGRDARVYLDGVGIGYGAQTEGNETTYPCIAETGEGSVGDMGALTRYAKAGGSFSYLFKVDRNKTNYLSCQYAPEDNGKTMRIMVGDVVVAEDVLAYDGKEEQYTVKYKIPAEAVEQAVSYAYTDSTTGTTEDRDVIRISFQGSDGQESPKLHTSAFTSTNYNSNAEVVSLASDIGIVEKAADKENSYIVRVPSNAKQVALTAQLADKYGLLYLDGVLLDDTKAKTVTLTGSETVLTYQVYGEDHETNAACVVTVIRDSAQAPDDSKKDDGKKDDGKKDDSGNSNTNTDNSNTNTGSTDSGNSQNPSGDAGQSGTTAQQPSIAISGNAEVAAGKSIKLKVTMQNVTGTPQWSVSPSKYASIKGKGTAATLKAKKKTGKVTVTVKVGNLKATKTVKVVNPVKSLKLNTKSKTLAKGKSFKLKVTVLPKNATNKKVTYTSSNSKVAAVSASGKVKAVKKGTATITVTSKSNPKAKIKCKVKVK